MKSLYGTSEISIALNRNFFSCRQSLPGKKDWSNFLTQHDILAFESNRMLVHHRKELCPCVGSYRPHINIGKSINELLQFDRMKQHAIAAIDHLRRVTADRFIR